MKRAIALLVVTAAAAAILTAKETVMAQESNENTVVRHVVLFDFKESATPEQIEKIERDFAALPQKIEKIKALEWGTNISPENLAKGYTHCFLVTFANEADRDAYIVHPAHKQFASTLGPALDKVLVVDYKAPAA